MSVFVEAIVDPAHDITTESIEPEYLLEDLFLINTPEAKEFAISRFTAYTSDLSYSGNMLLAAFKAVTRIEGAWGFLLMYETRSFMFQADLYEKDSELNPDDKKILDTIQNAVGNSYGHSGASYAYAMRNMEYIAKYGFKAFKNQSSQSIITDELAELDNRIRRFAEWQKSKILLGSDNN